MRKLIQNPKNFKHSFKDLNKFLKNNFYIIYKTHYNKYGNFVNNIIELKPKNFRYKYMSFCSMNNMYRHIDNFSIVEGFNI